MPTPNKNSEPIRLALDASDHMHEAQVSVGESVPRSRAPLMIVAALGVVLLLVAIAVIMRHASSPTAATEPAVDGVRSTAVPATATPAVAPQPTAPTTPTTAPTAPANTQHAAAPKAPAVQKPTEPQRAEETPRALSKPAPAAPAPTARPKHDSKAAASAPEESGEMQDARDALKELESGPVVRVKQKPGSDDVTDRALRDAINHPPSPDDAPVLKVKPEPSDEPPPPAP